MPLDLSLVVCLPESITILIPGRTHEEHIEDDVGIEQKFHNQVQFSAVLLDPFFFEPLADFIIGRGQSITVASQQAQGLVGRVLWGLNGFRLGPDVLDNFLN